MNIQTYKISGSWKSGDNLKPERIVSKEEAHDQDLLHLSIHLLLIDDEGKICCRKRSSDDFRYAGLWTTTIGTHVLQSSDYTGTLSPLLPKKMDLRWIGEFLVHDNWENEVNGLFVSKTNEIDLPPEFLEDRSFLTKEELEKLIESNKITPHLASAYKFLTESKIK